MIVLPKKIYLTAIGKEWKVSYHHTTPCKLTLVEYPHRKLVLYGKRYSKRAAMKLITRWIKLKSKIYLSALVIHFNRKIKAKYAKLRIHSLIMEWGSYSSKKVLGLNYKLIFLPPSLVKHLIIHELCHTRHLNHSPEFWKEVEKYDRNWKRNKMKLYAADIHIPEWVIF